MQELLDCGRADRVAPGGVLWAMENDETVHHRAFGRLDYTETAPATEPGTVFDVASLTKPTATVAVLMKLAESGLIDLDDPIRRWIPEVPANFPDTVRVRHLACHASGFPAHVKFYQRIMAGERSGRATAREATLVLAATTPLAYEPGSRSIYSDLGFIALGFAVERAGGARLDQLARRLVFEPLAMHSARFVDLEAGEVHPEPVAPTEDCGYRGPVRGVVHDQNTHGAGGILGQAGLFCTAADLGSFAGAICRAARGERGGLFDPDTVAAFVGPPAVPGSTWRLGWDTPSSVPGESHAGDRWSRDGFGHLGFTGTSMWLDPPRGRAAVLLTNAIHPSVEKPFLKRFRRQVMDSLVDQLDPAHR